MTQTAGAGETNVFALFAARARERPRALAISDGDLHLDYAALLEQAHRAAAGLAGRGIGRGDRVAILSENSIAYTVAQLACARIGAIAACLNWRLFDAELAYCVRLVDPAILLASQRFFEVAGRLGRATTDVAAIGDAGGVPPAARPEDGLLIIYTSGTTGLPKAAVISHRAEIARMCALRLDLGLSGDDGYIAWAPMFHMGGTEHTLATLMSGGHVVVVDGFHAGRIADALAKYAIGWLMLVPATIAPLLAELAAGGAKVKGVKAVGCMADLVPRAQIEAITRAVNAPYLNSFGATETGLPPLSGNLIPVGAAPAHLTKTLSSLTELRLVDADGGDVADGDAGEAWVRGPTLFSGYWNAPDADAACFSDGWFRMGDLFRKAENGYAFSGRSKYLIKSGGENIYPAEIEHVLLADPRVLDAIVVRRADPHWGEVPVAVVARNDPTLDAAEVERLCRDALARYKHPRDIVFVGIDDLPRSASGKIVREAVEKMIA